MSLQPPEKTRNLQAALHAKAKGSPGYRFYLLYDKVYREDVLAFAYRRCKANGGAAGVDGQRFKDIEAYGVERWLGELAEALRKKTCQPQAVRRVSDRHVLHLIKVWLEAPIEETDERGNTHRTTRNKDEGRGTPQGAPISPLLANLYLRRFVLGWKKLGYEQRFRAHIVNYADDLVICCRSSAEEASAAMQRLMERLGLTVNTSKTQVCRVPDDTFDFLDYTFGRGYSPKTGRAYIGTCPSRKRIARLCRALRDETASRWVSTDARDRVTRLNRMLLGWSNYFSLGSVSKAYRAIDAHTRYQLRWWLCRKHKVPGRGITRFPEVYLYRTLGLVRLESRTRSLLWANA